MARKVRLAPNGVPQHIQRVSTGGKRVFNDDDDLAFFCHWLFHYADTYALKIHAWAVLPDSFHLLATPEKDEAITRTLQATGRQFAGHVRRKYQRTGGLWYDRFRSSLILDDEWLLRVHHYIEALSDGGRRQPSASSYPQNASGNPQPPLTAHSAYQRIGKIKPQRVSAYQKGASALTSTQSETISRALKSNLALGDTHFIERLESVTGVRLTPGKRGRPAQSVEASSASVSSD